MPNWQLFGKKRRKKRKVSPRKKAAGRRPSARKIKKGSAGYYKAEAKRIIKKLTFAAASIVFAVLLWTVLALPSIDRLYDQNPNPGIVIHDSNGEIINTYGSVYGRYLKYDEVPKDLIDAILATEDRNFFYHLGFDPIGLTRAMLANISAGKVVQGGSTLTQQIAKNLFLSSERTYSRKFKELLMAMKLEYFFSKEELLEIYINRVYLGAGTFGVDAASQRYFAKSATKMNLAESAILTGLLKAPSRFAPTSSPERAKDRALQILVNMQDADYIDEKRRNEAKQWLKDFAAKKAVPSSNNYYYTDWILDEIPRYIGEINEDIVVVTTMSQSMQKQAAEAIEKAIDAEAEKKGATQAALMAMTSDGAVKAMMGGTSYSKTQFNRAVQSKRQPGSAFKLFVYLSAFEQGAFPDMQVMDEPISIRGWSPKNYGGKYKGLVSLREAVALSINTVAVRMGEFYGRNNIVAMARSLGVTSPLEPVRSLALGSYEITLKEMVTAFAHLASSGLAVEPYGITKISNKRGDVLYERKDTVPARVLSKEVVAMGNSVFSGVIQYGTARRAAIGRPAAGKTGTTSDYKDAWFVGYTPQLVAGVWVGNDEATSMKRISGGNLPAAIWGDFMRQAMAGYSVQPLPMAAGRTPEALPWLPGDASDSNVGGRHMPWQKGNVPWHKNVPKPSGQEAPPYNREKTKEFWDNLGL